MKGIRRQVAGLSRLFTLLILALALLLGVVPVAFDGQSSVHAAELKDRSIDIGDPSAGSTTTYVVGFNIATDIQYGSIEIEFCDNNPFVGTPCTPPAGFDISGATLALQEGDTGFIVHSASTVNKMVLSRIAVGPAGVVPHPVRYTFDDVVNPANGPQTYFIRVATYSLGGGAGGRIDEGGMAFSIHGGLGVNAFVPPYLTFCVAIVIPTNACSSGVGNTINFGTLASSNTASGTSQMIAATNGNGGYVINVLGTTMTSGNNTIPPLIARTASLQGVGQFGINIRDNINPDDGLEPGGLGSGLAFGDYGIPNEFTFRSGDIVAGVATPNDITRYTTTYIVNVPPEQPGGVYTTTISYIATATF